MSFYTYPDSHELRREWKGKWNEKLNFEILGKLDVSSIFKESRRKIEEKKENGWHKVKNDTNCSGLCSESVLLIIAQNWFFKFQI